MNIGRAALFFLGGYGIAAAILIIVAQWDWQGWFIMLGLSAPTTVVYFLMLYGLGHFGFESRVGMVIAGALCAAFPLLSFDFPVYFFQWWFAILLVLGQFGLLALIVAILSRIGARWFRVTGG